MSVRQKRWKRCLASLLSTAMMFSIVAVFGVMPQAKALNFMWPIVNGQNKVTQHYKTEHRATDISASIGTSVMASEGGTVIEAADNGCLGSHVSKSHACSKGSSCPALSAWKKKDSKSNTGGWGNWIIISHGDGFYTVYAHLQSGSFRVSVGQTVSKGQVIASSGAAGETYGAHLHFEMRKGGNGWNNRVNAENYLGTGSTPDPNADNLGCSTAYAGWYKVNDGGANINSRHNKTKWGDYVSEYAGGTYVYVNKASGEGRGNIGHVTYNGVERYVAMGLLTRMRGNPIGSVDSYGGDAGSVWLNGWAFDWDNCEAQLQINVYLDNTLVYQGRADGERSDVNATYSNVVGSYHGFSFRVPTNLVGKFKFDVYAINVGTGDHTCLKSDWVTIQRVADTEAPVISNVQVSNITNQGYDISCTVTDNVGVDYVKFPTWTLANGQDDLGDWGSNPLFTGNRSGNTWTYHVNVSDHNNEGGTYQTDIRAYDTSGNLGSYLEIQVGIDREGPTISNVQVSNVTNTGYDVSCTVTDPSGVDRVQFPTWTTLNGQDDLLSDWSVNSAARGTQNGDTWTFHVNIADHNNEGGDYLTHIHAYDKYGNSTSSSAGVVSIDVEPPVIRNIQVSNVTSKGYDVSCTVTDNVGVNRVVFPTWTDRNGQDDITSEWWSVDHFATRGTQYGDTWTFHVDIADHNHESGLYHTHIYAYDDAGNRECNTTDAAEVVVPEPASTVTFDANGGTAEFDSKEVEYGDVLGVLPEADRSHYVFLGWYTDPEDGDRVTDQSDVTGSVTLYAHWVPAFGAGWQLEDGVLTIENDGAMEDYAAASDAPWFRLRSQIQSVIVSEGVTSLSSYAFYGCDELEEVSLPQSLCRIGSLAFGGCTKLSSIVIPSDVLLIGDYAFVGDDALQSITFEGHAPEIGVGAFSDVTATVIYKGNDQSWTEDIRQSYLGSLTWTSSV